MSAADAAELENGKVDENDMNTATDGGEEKDGNSLLLYLSFFFLFFSLCVCYRCCCFVLFVCGWFGMVCIVAFRLNFSLFCLCFMLLWIFCVDVPLATRVKVKKWNAVAFWSYGKYNEYVYRNHCNCLVNDLVFHMQFSNMLVFFFFC